MNGAGKSTLMRIVARLSRPTEGEVRWEERPLSDRPNRLHRVLGYLLQEFGVYPRLTGREFFRYLAAAKGLPGDRLPSIRQRHRVASAVHRADGAQISYYPELDAGAVIELETVYTLSARDGRLVATHRWNGELPVTPVEEDAFEGEWLEIRFERNEVGIVTGFYASAGRTVDVWFRKRD